MIERTPEKVFPDLETDEIAPDLFDANIHLILGEQSVADAETEIIRRITGHTLSTKEYDDIHQAAYFERRDAEIELKRAQRRETRSRWLGRLGL